MSDKITQSPQIRFAGFTNAWENMKLKEVVDIRSGRDYKHLSEGDIPVYGTGGYMLSVSEALSYAVDAIGIGRKGTIDKPYILRAPFWTVDTLFYAIPKEKYDLNFVYSVFKRVNWKQKDESTGVPSLSKTAINEVLVAVSEYKEQIKIGTFFSQIDNLVNLHQHKLKLLKDTKKILLQKMFPKDGSNVPEVRFAGFIDEWEQKKLNELVTSVVREVPKPEGPYKRISVRSHAKGTFHQKVDDPKTVSMDKLYVVKENDLIVNITFAWEHAIAVAKKEDDGLLVSHRFPMFVINKSDINFINYSVSKENFRKKMELISPGGAGRNRVLNKKDFVNLMMDVPIQIEEQTKIGKFFKQLDYLIILHQRELNLLNDLKQSMLQQMFM